MDWHRLFGLLLTDFFTDSPFEVELEKDLSLKQQFLDVVILRRRPGKFEGRLPDGLEDLAAHNLVSFKSHQEALDDWALKELTGHYVSYRKLLSRQNEPLLPESEFRLYAVCSRFPHNLAGQVQWEELQAGVYRCRRGTDCIKVIVARQLPESDHNAPLHLFSGAVERVGFGARHYKRRSNQTSTVLDRLFEGYRSEGLAMPYTMEDFSREYLQEKFLKMTPEERQRLLDKIPAEERLHGLSPEEIQHYLQQMKKAPMKPPGKANGGKGKTRPKR
jgi:hypothetical protein